jgi:HSP20 family protein
MDMTLFTPLFDTWRDMDRLFATSGTMTRSFVPAADVVVTDDDVTVTMDVPGLKADDIAIELEGDTLTVRGERTSPYATGKDDEGRVLRRLERGFGKFERVLRVPKGLDPDAITASIADGVLTVHIPMPETRKPRRIEIATGDTQPALEQSPVDDQQVELAAAAA